MKTKVITIIGVILLCSGTMNVCSGDTVTTGGTMTGIPVTLREQLIVVQHTYDPGATDLHFKVWQNEDDIDIEGWEISISHFTQSSSKRGDQPDTPPSYPHSTLNNYQPSSKNTDPDNGQHAIDVVADFASPSDIVPWGTPVVIDVTLYIGYCNDIRVSDFKWTMDDDEQPGAGDFGWDIGYPFAITDQPIEYLHTLTIKNDGTDGTLWLTDLKILASADDYDNLADVPFRDEIEISIDDRQLRPDKPYVVDIPTTGTFVGNFIYHTFKIGRSENDPDAVLVTAQHPVVEPKPKRIPAVSEWGLIVMTLLLVSAGAIVIWRRQRIVA